MNLEDFAINLTEVKAEEIRKKSTCKKQVCVSRKENELVSKQKSDLLIIIVVELILLGTINNEISGSAIFVQSYNGSRLKIVRCMQKELQLRIRILPIAENLVAFRVRGMAGNIPSSS